MSDFKRSRGASSQDQYGFLWFGTVDGLFRHDGYNLKTYRHDASNPNSLSENFIRSVYRDRSGMLWIATISGGLDKLDPATGHRLRTIGMTLAISRA